MTIEQEKMFNNVCATMSLEDMNLNEDEIQIVKDIITGKLNYNTFIKELKSKYQE